MTDINSIKPGTVFAWFMLVLIVRRIVLIVMLIVTKQKTSPGLPPPDTSDRPTRINGAIRNDSENDAYFLILYLGTAIFSYSVNADIVRMIVYGAVYLTTRSIHSVMFILALQPHRMLAFLFGLLCTFAMSLDLVITMSRTTN
ncbi:unnamed protein product [Rotaria magnacalcarata]|uniref:Uncharacterized protein n=1 Tax=Rotaria magnacalcarata TaxID=392030 RepID=A0A815M6A2_9BILA|nr:unnamed protein product [Rotaria magnacalcarata]CAF1603466.1 unnamed protein product [Rotaria magnacalcarata]CAF2096379.1 unnamed protein product [Rotaria magnacalcarata]CAF3824326.1 unnamed protein product [Rotaria magnacalcarata]CAF3875975.1 unnamed protein product [Rotaria magnacalcarata]